MSQLAFANDCGPKQVVARVESLQGQLTLNNQPTTRGALVCANDLLATGLFSRAAIRLFETQTLLRLDQQTQTRIQPPPRPSESWLKVLEGVLHLFSRDPRSLEIDTPLANALVEGTEFVVRVTEQQTQITVVEGNVQVNNNQGTVHLSDRQTAFVTTGRAPQLSTLITPEEAVQWTLYYPPVLLSLVDKDRLPPSLRPTQGEFNNPNQALTQLARVPRIRRNEEYYLYRAGWLLAVGQADQAQQALEQARDLNPNSARARALQAVIAVTQNDTEMAQSLAKDAVQRDPESAAGYLALSYALQAVFQLDDALASVQQAVARDRGNALAKARLAELQLAQGNLNEALDVAAQAAAQAPNLAHTQTVLGFAYLSQIDTGHAKRAFEQAISLDQTAPLPRLGLGLALIRESNLKDGRANIETAVALDPLRSLYRSYLGKAYFEEKRDILAGDQYMLAKQLDPLDPTPWLYDAIRKQTENRPVEALEDIQQSIELNDNRAVYRSRLLLDEDVATRSTNLSRTYDDLGFEQRARIEAWKSINADPANFSGHRFLADSYATLQRHEIARVSELLQSQLLQPTNITPLQAELGVSDLAILQGAGPSSLSFNEFNPLFTRNGAALQANAIFGTDGTMGDDLVVSGIHGPFSGSAGQFHYETHGFRPNNDIEHNIYNAFAQVTVTPKLSLQAEMRRRESEAGDVDIELGPLDPTFRQRINQDSARVGGHYQPVPRHDLLASFIYTDGETITNQRSFDSDGNDVDLNVTNPVDGYTAELQHLFRGGRIKTIAGIGYVRLRDRLIFTETPFGGMDESSVRTVDPLDRQRLINGYMYAPITLGSKATITLGASYDSLHTLTLDRNQFNPKFGLVWDVTPSTILRIAAFRVLKRFFATDQTLEPTQLAGFNQFFDDLNGTDSTRYGFGLDQRFSHNIFAGFELSWRDLTRYVTSGNNGIPEEQDEQFHRVYVHWAPHRQVALAAEYQFEKFDRDKILVAGNSIFTGLPEIRTHYVPLNLSYYHPNGLFTRLGATYVHQDATTTDRLMSGDERFWVVDASIGYRLPKRYGLVSIDVKNLLDEEFSYQNSFNEGEQKLPRYQPQRAIFARLNLWFY
jgi:tetratricopeptide (TPR) repeat protein